MNREEEEESSEEESSEEEDSSDDEPVAAGGSGSTTAKLPPAMAAMNLKLGNTEPVEGPEMSRAERKALKKAQSEGKKKVVGGGADDDEEKDGEDEEESSEDELLNPHKAMLKRQAEKARAAKTPGKVVPAEMSRKDRWVFAFFHVHPYLHDLIIHRQKANDRHQRSSGEEISRRAIRQTTR